MVRFTTVKIGDGNLAFIPVCKNCGGADFECFKAYENYLCVRCKTCKCSYGISSNGEVEPSLLNYLNKFLNNQSNLRVMFEKLIEDDRSMRSEERDGYHKLLDKSLLGVDYHRPNPLSLKEMKLLFPQKHYQEMRTLGHFLRGLAYVDPKGEFHMAEYWRLALCELNSKCWGLALQLAFKIIKKIHWGE